ncbi:hypothetical protein ACFY2K_14615 [Kitasatospora sp. NPDC001309]|uniref:hypothetical protein n=1 Tax=Kitasatospora sp. NPDC001309 TaxID=3364013 RepID=UPI003685D12C
MNEPPEPPAGPGRASRAGRLVRSTVSAVLIALTCVLVPVSLLTVWVHDIALDTGRYVATVAPLATDPAIQDAAVARITQAVDVRVDGPAVTSDLAAWLQAHGLPPRVASAVKALGPKLDDAVNQVVTEAATRVVHSDSFVTVWTQANRVAHTAVVQALTGHGRGAVEVTDGTVTLDLGSVVDRLKDTLVAEGLSPAERIPDVDKRMVLFQSDRLARIRGAAHALDVVGNWLPVLTVSLGAVGVLLARRRRRALVSAALGAAGASLLVALALVAARHYYLDHLPPAVQSSAAAAAVFDTLLHFLRISLRTATVLGVAVALGAYLGGAGRLPRAARGRADRAADSVAHWGDAHGVRAGRAGTWTAAHRRWLAGTAVLVLALVFALWDDPTALTVLLLVAILLAVLAVLALLAAFGRAATGGPDGSVLR